MGIAKERRIAQRVLQKTPIWIEEAGLSIQDLRLLAFRVQGFEFKM